MSPEGALRDGNDPSLRLIETFRWEPAGGVLHRARHVGRLAASADALGFTFPAAEIKGALDSLAGEGPLRARLTLARDGTVEATTQHFAPLPPDAIWRLRVAATRLDSADPWLRHKTTRRALYEAARAEFTRDEADEAILLNERGEVCEGTITSLFADMGDGGPWQTPALRCGLLPGVFRASLIESGGAVEAVLTPAELESAAALFAGNSLRGPIRARLAGSKAE